MIGANERLQIESLTPRDVAIDVPMGDIGTGDFQRIPEAVELGRRAADGMRDSSAATRSRKPIPRLVDSLGRTQAPETELAEVRIVGTERVNPEYVRAQLENSAPGAIMTAEAIAEDTERVYALGDFEGVDYRSPAQPARACSRSRRWRRAGARTSSGSISAWPRTKAANMFAS